ARGRRRKRHRRHRAAGARAAGERCEDLALAGHRVRCLIAIGPPDLRSRLAMAWRRLPTTSGLASLRKPICVSLMCTNVNAPLSPAAGVPGLVAPSARGTPPLTVQTTAAPLQADRHFSAWRRSGD